MTVRDDVFDFLLPIDPQRSMVYVAEALAKASSTKETAQLVADTYQVVRNLLNNPDKPIFNAKHSLVYGRIRTRKNALVDYSVPDFVETLLLTTYLRAKVSIEGMGSKSFLRNLDENLKKVKPALEAMDAEFFGELLVETELRARDDPAFSKSLILTAREIISHIPELEALRPGFAFLDDDEEECGCIVHACNFLGECGEFCIISWMICILIIFGIIVSIIL